MCGDSRLGRPSSEARHIRVERAACADPRSGERAEPTA